LSIEILYYDVGSRIEEEELTITPDTVYSNPDSYTKKQSRTDFKIREKGVIVLGIPKSDKKQGVKKISQPLDLFIGAGNGDRTRDPRLGKPMLYQLSYARPIVS
jgi:hypothetical protein